MRYDVLALISGMTACGGSQQHVVTSEPRSWAEHMESAQEHEQAAAEHEDLARDYKRKYESEQEGVVADAKRGFRDEPHSWVCGDTVIQDQVTSGGHELTHSYPCYNVYVEPWWRHHFIAEDEREEAHDQLHAAGDLVRAVNAACEGLPESVRATSVFAQRGQIAEVIPHRVGGSMRGVMIVFQPTAGFSADQVRRGVACRRAMWTMHGQLPGEAGNDPTLVPDSEVDVRETAGSIVVVVTAHDAQAAAVAIARASGTPPPAGSQPEQPEVTARR